MCPIHVARLHSAPVARQRLHRRGIVPKGNGNRGAERKLTRRKTIFESDIGIWIDNQFLECCCITSERLVDGPSLEVVGKPLQSAVVVTERNRRDEVGAASGRALIGKEGAGAGWDCRVVGEDETVCVARERIELRARSWHY